MSTRELRTRLAQTVGRVRFAGDRVVITSHGAAAAALVPLEDLHRLEELGEAPVPVVHERRVVPGTPQQVWWALTDQWSLLRWWDDLELDPWVGGAVHERIPQTGGRLVVLSGRVTCLLPPEEAPEAVLGIDWEERGHPHPTTVRITVTAEGDGSRVEVTETGWGRREHDRADEHRTRWISRWAALRRWLSGPGLTGPGTTGSPAAPPPRSR